MPPTSVLTACDVVAHACQRRRDVSLCHRHDRKADECRGLCRRVWGVSDLQHVGIRFEPGDHEGSVRLHVDRLTREGSVILVGSNSQDGVLGIQPVRVVDAAGDFEFGTLSVWVASRRGRRRADQGQDPEQRSLSRMAPGTSLSAAAAC